MQVLRLGGHEQNEGRVFSQGYQGSILQCCPVYLLCIDIDRVGLGMLLDAPVRLLLHQASMIWGNFWIILDHNVIVCVAANGDCSLVNGEDTALQRSRGELN